MLLEAVAVLAVVGIAAAVFVLWYTSPVCVPASQSELSFLDPASKKRDNFPSLLQQPSPSAADQVVLSVVVPAYNEEQRLPPMLEESLAFLEEKQQQEGDGGKFTYEVIVVDDGSRDKTTQVALEFTKKFGANKVRVLTFARNRGKGGAIRWGTLSARGKYILFADGDGATKFADIDKLLAAIKRVEKNGLGIAVGSRAHLQDEAVAKRTVLRNILMYGFHVLVWLVGIHGIRDTQCGFKLFTRDSARVLFSAMHVERWCFDIELLFLALKLKYPIVEVSVNWQEIDGSKLDPFWSSVQMFKDIFLIRLYYLLGLWSVPSNRSSSNDNKKKTN